MSRSDFMATLAQIAQFAFENDVRTFLSKAIQNNLTQSEIEFGLRIKEIQILEVK